VRGHGPVTLAVYSSNPVPSILTNPRSLCFQARSLETKCEGMVQLLEQARSQQAEAGAAARLQADLDEAKVRVASSNH